MDQLPILKPNVVVLFRAVVDQGIIIFLLADSEISPMGSIIFILLTAAGVLLV
jgi:hypothetical protein